MTIYQFFYFIQNANEKLLVLVTHFINYLFINFLTFVYLICICYEYRKLIIQYLKIHSNNFLRNIFLNYTFIYLFCHIISNSRLPLLNKLYIY